MLGRTRKHHTKETEKLPLKKQTKPDKSVKAKEHFHTIYGETPEASVYLAGLRYLEDLTQKQLGDLLGVHQTNISKMENGKRLIGKKMAKRLADIFKVDYRLFL